MKDPLRQSFVFEMAWAYIRLVMIWDIADMHLTAKLFHEDLQSWHKA
jgi:hypothetical protein